jgi:selenocysteine lyase/cysteine desulfurase
MDYAPYLCVPDAIKFREGHCGGEDKILKYTITLAKQGADRVASILGTDVLGDEDQRECPLTMVRLPVTFSDEDIKEEKHKSVHAWIEKTAFQNYGAFVPLIYHGGHLWTRLSAQVYLTLKDFDTVGQMLSELCARAAKRKTSSL